ncbi:MAG: efflux RND transporter periplasmic adaptor subunit [Bacteroidota bacterium]|nr:efflux RND transporter periplasmic adaptor subunit [Bacteroidota bacterium]
MKNILAFGLATTLLLASCSQPDKKAELEKLRTQEAELLAQIEKLETEIGNNDTSKVKTNLVETQTIQMQLFSTYIDIQGRIDADENVGLSSEIPGTITKINVKVGDEVSKGQVLAETDARTVQQSISDLQTNLDLVNQLFDKQKGLWDQKIGTEVQYLQAKTNKESLEKKMLTLQEQLRMTKIISPISGTVDAVDIKLGQAVAPGLPAIRVINFSNLKVKADVAEVYAGRISKGDAVKVYFPDTGDSLESKVNFAARAINNVTRTFTVEVLLDNKKDYHPNIVTRLKINDYTSPTPVVAVPVKLIQNEIGGGKFVYISEAGKAVKKVVKTGKEYNGLIEITEGLKQGDKLVSKGYDTINEGDLISAKK